MKNSRRAVWAWAAYDWGNSAFATAVMAGFFPIFFKEYWASSMEATESSFWLGTANSVAGILVLVMAPILGAMADQGGGRKRFLVLFATLGIAATAGLFLVGEGAWGMAALAYTVGVVGFMGANVFYDALIVDVVDESRLDKTSALGFGVGYLGGGLLFAFTVAMTLTPQTFGLADAAEAVRWSFLLVALWWAVFTFPLWRWVDEPRLQRRSIWQSASAGFQQLRETFRHLRQLKTVMHFLLAYWFYIDAVDTVIRMAVDYGLSIGLSSEDLITALLVVQFVGFPAALLFGWMGSRYGPKPIILLGLAVYVVIILWAWRMQAAWEFYTLAVAIGLVQGGVQALSRSLYARLIPADKSAEFFGFYNMLGKFAAVIGPILMGTAAVLTGSSRDSILAILVLLLIGAVLLATVDTKKRPAA